MALPLAGWALVGCTSADKGLVNGLIAETLTDEGLTEVSDSKKTAFTAEFNEAGDEVTVEWNSGPLKKTPRTFEETDPGYYELADGLDDEDGWLVAGEMGAAGFAFGYVGNIETGEGALGAGHFGLDATNLPTTGEVVYNGEVVGSRLNTGTGSGISPFYGDAQITANFGDGTVDGLFDNLSGGLSNVTFEGEMSKGNTLYSAKSVAVGGLGATGTVIGGFYGVGGRDTSGVFDITTSGVDPTRIGGGFAASAPPPP